MLDTAFILSATLGTVALLSIIGYFIGWSSWLKQQHK
jgi:hypothetical protein